MASGGDDDRRGKRKMAEPHDKDPPRCGHGRIVVGSSSATGRGSARDRERRDRLIQEENLERAGCTIPSSACPDTAPHLEEFDRGYIRDYPEEVIMRCPAETRAHPMINYVGKQKFMEEARENNPYE